MNDRILYIKWDSGEMEIVLAEFFPTTIERFKKLLKIIRLDWQNQDEIIEFLKVYFQNRADECEAQHRASGKEYVNNKQKVSDLTRKIESRKHPNGVWITRKEWDMGTNELRKLKLQQSKLLDSFKRNKRKVEQFQRHIKDIS